MGVLELFVFVSMHTVRKAGRWRSVVEQGSIIIQEIGEADDVWKTWESFDASSCDCFDATDKEKMVAIFAQGQGGLSRFNREVRSLLRTQFRFQRRAESTKFDCSKLCGSG